MRTTEEMHSKAAAWAWYHHKKKKGGGGGGGPGDVRPSLGRGTRFRSEALGERRNAVVNAERSLALLSLLPREEATKCFQRERRDGKRSDDGAAWDCGSTLYDSFELLSLSNTLGRCLTTVRTVANPSPNALATPNCHYPPPRTKFSIPASLLPRFFPPLFPTAKSTTIPPTKTTTATKTLPTTKPRVKPKSRATPLICASPPIIKPNPKQKPSPKPDPPTVPDLKLGPKPDKKATSSSSSSSFRKTLRSLLAPFHRGDKAAGAKPVTAAASPGEEEGGGILTRASLSDETQEEEDESGLLEYHHYHHHHHHHYHHHYKGGGVSNSKPPPAPPLLPQSRKVSGLHLGVAKGFSPFLPRDVRCSLMQPPPPSFKRP